jgi:hypothetical protein
MKKTSSFSLEIITIILALVFASTNVFAMSSTDNSSVAVTGASANTLTEQASAGVNDTNLKQGRFLGEAKGSGFLGFGDKEKKVDQPVRIKFYLSGGVTESLISAEPATLKLKLLYRDTFSKEFKDRNMDELAEAINESFIFKKQANGISETLDLEFTFQNGRDSSNLDYYHEMIFQSVPIDVSSAQLISVETKINTFLEKLGMEPYYDNKTLYKAVAFKPIDVFKRRAQLTDFEAIDDETYTATVNFKFNLLKHSNLTELPATSSLNLGLDQSIIIDSFNFTKDKKKYIPWMKDRKSKRAIKLELDSELIGSNFIVSVIGDNKYEGSFDLTFKPKFLGDYKYLGKERKFNINIPLLLKATNVDGLEVKMRTVAKAKKVVL